MSTSTTMVTCIHKNGETTDCIDATNGTVAKFQCANFYEIKDSRQKRAVTCVDGRWDEEEPECVPVCGRRLLNVGTLIINGTKVKKGGYPWQVAIYEKKNKNLICGGTLISDRVILTAAHCLTNKRAGLHFKEEFIVAVGKYYRIFDDIRDFSEAQFANLSHMFVSKDYRILKGNYQADIALLVTSKAFTFTSRVLPACLDYWDMWSYPDEGDKGEYGYVAGWGYTTENGKYSNELNQLKVPFVTHEKCLQNLSVDYYRFCSADKYCAGFINKGTSVCKGDDGSGLFVKRFGRYHVVGILSIPSLINLGGCHRQHYALYTKVSAHMFKFILHYLSQALRLDESVKEDQCLLPDYPINGQWTIVSSTSFQKPKELVSSGTIVNATCDKFYHLHGPPAIKCNHGKWNTTMGTCFPLCPPIERPFLEAKCYNISGDCGNAIHGTMATLKCKKFYENLNLDSNPFVKCINGQWSPEIPECTPTCGAEPETFFRQFPWNVAIYEREVENNTFRCTGTLVAQNVVLTSARCVTDEEGNLLLFSKYVVIAGELVQNHNDSKTQYSDLEDIIISNEYRGAKWEYWADIALIVTKDRFILNSRVQLACLDWDSMFTKELEHPELEKLVDFPTRPNLVRVHKTKISLVNFANCDKQLSSVTSPNNYSPFYYSDKLCSSYVDLNKIIPCTLHRGTGLFTKNKYDNRYYLIGVTSISPLITSGICENQTWVLFTNVSRYMPKLIRDKIELYKPESTSYLQPSCGIKSVQADELIVGGESTEMGEYPWQVAIYRKNDTTHDFICGGSLLNSKIILTAAHCVTDSYGHQLPKQLFTVAVGKFYSDFQHRDDKKAQFSELSDISVPSQYDGYLQNYLADIAVLISENSFVFSENVKPVCIDWYNKYRDYLLRPSSKGYVSGWGLTKETGKVATELRDVEVPYVDKDLCKKALTDYAVFLTHDKICLGHLNQSKSVCQGDSGSGVVFKNNLDSRYYIMGIVSISPRSTVSGGCDSQRYTLYTDISNYVKNFILHKVRLYWR